MPRWMADDVHLAVPQIMRVSGFPFMESGWNGDYILDMTIKDQVVYRRVNRGLSGPPPPLPSLPSGLVLT
eukprot:m.366950 g.366950  ORF g.366950 m.366950 type:complete len:70 (+) comp28097_c0_seq8:336-545(+)